MSSSDAYLDVAENVLQLIRRPLSTREILREAVLRGMLPTHLHGRTQHKTIGARLSEDILSKRERSRFFRPRPGRFFLSALRGDPSIPDEYKTAIIAKRRVRELRREYLAYFDRHALPEKSTELSPTQFRRLVADQKVEYRLQKDGIGHSVPLFTASFVRRKSQILTYTKGRYAELRSNFQGKRTLLFSSPIAHDDYTLFDVKDHGAVTAALTALAIDLDLEFSPEFTRFEQRARLKLCLLSLDQEFPFVLTAVEVEAPSSYQPFSKRLSIGGFEWTSLNDACRNASQFEPWSQELISKLLLEAKRD